MPQPSSVPSLFAAFVGSFAAAQQPSLSLNAPSLNAPSSNVTTGVPVGSARRHPHRDDPGDTVTPGAVLPSQCARVNDTQPQPVQPVQPAQASTASRVARLTAAYHQERANRSAGLPSDVPARADGRAGRWHEDGPAKKKRITSLEYARAAFMGCHLPAGTSAECPYGEVREHPNPCKCPLPAASPGMRQLACWENLWDEGFDSLRDHLHKMMNMSQEVRTQFVYERLHGCFYADEGPDGLPAGPARWHFRIQKREICRELFATLYGIGLSTLNTTILPRIKLGFRKAHAKREREEDGSSSAVVEGGLDKTLIVIGWMLAYAEDVGDYMPHRDETIIPRRERKDEWEEFCSGRTPDECCTYEHFCKVAREASELQHICHARECFNFQHCKQCVNLNAEVASAAASGNATAVAAAKAKRARHHALQRGERLRYYSRRQLGMTNPSDNISIIIDKWDSAKSTCPYFARAPKDWTEVKKEALQQHVLGILVHAQPTHSVYLYTFNDSISGDANVNCEGLRRMLVSRYSKTRMPRCLMLQADNASDNKNWCVLLFLAMLVYYRFVCPSKALYTFYARPQ